MKFEELCSRRQARQLTQEQAAEMSGVSVRTVRRWEERFDANGAEGLYDRRPGKMANNRVPADTAMSMLELFDTKYWDYTTKHFHEKLVEMHGFTRSCNRVRMTLQRHGRIQPAPRRGAHRRKRPRRPMAGMMLHQDGSTHEWVPGKWWDLIVTMDDANNEIYSAFFVPEEGTMSSFVGIGEAIEKKGLFCSLHADRGSHYWHTPEAGGKVDRNNPTRVGRALQQLVCRKLAAPDRKVPLSGLMHRAGQRRGQDRCSPGSRPVAEYDHPRLFSDPNRYRRRGTSPGLVTTRTGDEKVMNTTIGIDISKDHLDAHRLTDGASARFANTPDGLKALSRWLGAETCRVVYEATGRYHRDLEATLSRAGHGLVKVNPKRARRFAEAIGLEAKSDPIDAAMLARMGAALDLKPIEPPSDAMRDLHELRSARTALIKDQTACTNRLQDARARLVRKQLKARLRQIGRQIAQLDAELHQCIQDDDGLARRFNILTSIPGIGPVAAVSILADMPETGTLSSREVAALAGLAPHVRQSGKRTGRAMIAGGRAGLRCALYMPALPAIRCNPPLGQVYTALRSAGKPFRVALVAVMRKLLILANTLIREDRKWSPARPENGGEHAA